MGHLVDIDHLQLRLAGATDAEGIARLHADSWRRHYRGVYSDTFLDGDVESDRRAVWVQQLREPVGNAVTIVAEDGVSLLGFVRVVFDDDQACGALVDNIHVVFDRKRRGIGTRLMGRAADAVIERSATSGLYLWVNQQNPDAQAFYEAHGGRCSEQAPSVAPGGDASRLNGSPLKLRYVWPDPAVLLLNP